MQRSDSVRLRARPDRGPLRCGWIAALGCVVAFTGAARARADACVVEVRGTVPYVRLPKAGSEATAFRLADAVARVELATQEGDDARLLVSAPLELETLIPADEQHFALAHRVDVGRRPIEATATSDWRVMAPHGDTTGMHATLVGPDGERIERVALPCDAVGPLVTLYEGAPFCGVLDPVTERRRAWRDWTLSTELPVGTPVFASPGAPRPWATVSRALHAVAIHARGATRTAVVASALTPCTGWAGMWVDVETVGVGRVARAGLELRAGGLDSPISPARVIAVAPGSVFARAGLRARDEITAVTLPHARRDAFNLSPTELGAWIGWGATLDVRRDGRALRVVVPRAPGCPTHPDERAPQCRPW